MLKATGIVRRIDDLGRIVTPKELRRTYGIKDGDPMEIFATDTGIVLNPIKKPNEELLEQLRAELDTAVGVDHAERIMTMIEKAMGCISDNSPAAGTAGESR